MAALASILHAKQRKPEAESFETPTNEDVSVYGL